LWTQRSLLALQTLDNTLHICFFKDLQELSIHILYCSKKI